MVATSKMENKIYELIILGAGPAGVAGAIYAHRKNITTLLIGDNFGGQAVVAAKIVNIPGQINISGAQMSQSFENQIKDIGVPYSLDRIEKVEKQGDVFVVKTAQNVFQAKNILVTLGRKYKDLGLADEEKYKGRGLFYCSTCDAPIFKDRVAMVIGSGNSALNSVIDLSPFASKIYVLTHGDAMRGDAVLQEEIKKNPKVEIIFNANVSGLEGDLMIKAIKYKDSVSQEEKRLEVFGAFVNIGMKPNAELVKDLVQLNEGGEIITDFLGRTSQPGIWAAGDITSLPYKQISVAIGDGIRAALDVYAEVKKPKNKDAI